MRNIMETLEQFSERMSHVEKIREHIVGSRHSGNSRAVFKFEGQYCYLESTGFATYKDLGIPVIGKALLMALNKPSDYWWTDYMSYGKQRAKKIAKYYNATLSEAPYAKESEKWFYYCFNEFEDLMRFVYDRHTGVFIKIHGRECNNYVSCINDKSYDMNVIEATT